MINLTEDIFSEPSVTDFELNSSESGQTLDEVIRNIRHQPYEIMAFFDACGNKICEHTNHQAEYALCSIPDKWFNLINLMVHNHTIDGTFSPLDLVCIGTTAPSVSIVVSPSCNFYLFRPMKGWPDLAGAASEYETIIEVLLRHPQHNYCREAARHLALCKVARHYDIQYRVEAVAGAVLPSIFATNA